MVVDRIGRLRPAAPTATAEAFSVLGVRKPNQCVAGMAATGCYSGTFEGERMLSLHTPNDYPKQRPVFLPLIEANGRILIKEKP